MFDGAIQPPARAYGANGATFSELYMSFERSNFRLDVLHELNARQRARRRRPDGARCCAPASRASDPATSQLRIGVR